MRLRSKVIFLYVFPSTINNKRQKNRMLPPRKKIFHSISIVVAKKKKNNISRSPTTGAGCVRDRDGRSSAHGRGVDPHNAQHLDQESQIPGAGVLGGEFLGDGRLHRHDVHHEPRRAVHNREAIRRGLAGVTSVLWHCDIFFRGYYSGECTAWKIDVSL